MSDTKAVAVMPEYLAPQTLNAIDQIAERLAVAGYVPKGLMGGSRQEVCARVACAIMHGQSVGLTPIQAVQGIAVINGVPSVWGDTQKALVDGSGLVEDRAEHYEGNKGSEDYTAVVTIKRKGRATPVTTRFSVADARKAGVWGKQGPWSQYPEQMLMNRARSFAHRNQFSDVLKGLHSAEEMQDAAPLDGGMLRTDAPRVSESKAALDQATAAARESRLAAEIAAATEDNAQDAEIVDWHEEAMKVASSGTDAFRAWFKTLEPAARAILKERMTEYQAAATKADSCGDDEDPFATEPREWASEVMAFCDDAKNAANTPAGLEGFIADDYCKTFLTDLRVAVAADASLAPLLEQAEGAIQ